MSDDRPDHGEAEVVSAYVDGEATPEEARVVEADTALLADVRRLRALKDGLAEVPSLSPEHRDRLLAGALAEFDSQHGTAAPPPSRTSGGRWLAVAAAAVAVVAAAGLAVSLVTTSDSDDVDAPTAGRADEVAVEDEQNPITQSADTTTDETAPTDTSGGDVGASEADFAEGSESSGELAASDAAPAATTRAAAGAEERARGLEELSDEPAMVDWVLRVQDGDLSPEGQGRFVCGREVLGVATHRGVEVAVAIEGDYVVARDTGNCRQVLSADTP